VNGGGREHKKEHEKEGAQWTPTRQEGHGHLVDLIIPVEDERGWAAHHDPLAEFWSVGAFKSVIQGHPDQRDGHECLSQSHVICQNAALTIKPPVPAAPRTVGTVSGWIWIGNCIGGRNEEESSKE
jgi:hypothetical protein